MFFNDGTNRSKVRPGIIMKFPDNKLRIIRCSRVTSDRSTEITDDPLTIQLVDYTSDGLPQPTYLVPWVIRELYMVEPISYLGHLTSSDYRRCKDTMSKWYNSLGDNPKYLMGFLKGYNISLRTIHKFDSVLHNISELKNHMKCNSMDIANLSHTIAESAKLENAIGCITVLPNDIRKKEEVYTTVFFDNKGRIRVFRFVPSTSTTESYGDIVFSKEDTLFEAFSKEGDEIKKYHPTFSKIKGRYVKRLIEKESLKLWDKLASENTPQNEMSYIIRQGM